MKVEGLAVGIDLGTTYSCVAWYNGFTDTAVTLTNEHGGLTTPSCVAFDPCAGARLFGDDAKRQAAIK